jgi:hypothetical protein
MRAMGAIMVAPLLRTGSPKRRRPAQSCASIPRRRARTAYRSRYALPWMPRWDCHGHPEPPHPVVGEKAEADTFGANDPIVVSPKEGGLSIPEATFNTQFHFPPTMNLCHPPFALAVSLETAVGTGIAIYDEVRAAVQPAIRATAGTR